MAPGVNGTDAVNVSQLGATNAQVNTNTSNIARNARGISTNAANIATNARGIANNAANITRNRADISQNRTNIDRNRNNINNLKSGLDDLRSESRAGIAAAAALVELMPSGPGKTTVNIGSATFKDQYAVGITTVHRFAGIANMMVNAGVSFADDAVLARAGASWEF